MRRAGGTWRHLGASVPSRFIPHTRRTACDGSGRAGCTGRCATTGTSRKCERAVQGEGRSQRNSCEFHAASCFVERTINRHDRTMFPFRLQRKYGLSTDGHSGRLVGHGCLHPYREGRCVVGRVVRRSSQSNGEKRYPSCFEWPRWVSRRAQPILGLRLHRYENNQRYPRIYFAAALNALSSENLCVVPS
jgi:hypothetical protein